MEEEINYICQGGYIFPALLLFVLFSRFSQIMDFRKFPGEQVCGNRTNPLDFGCDSHYNLDLFSSVGGKGEGLCPESVTFSYLAFLSNEHFFKIIV